MGATGMFLLGGLLSGTGQAITNNANALREQALLNLKHQYDIEDRTANNDAAMARVQAENQGKLDEIAATGTQQRQTEVVKGAVDKANIAFKGQIDLNNDTAIKTLEHRFNVSEDQVKSALELQNQLALAGQTVDHWAVTTDGKMVAFNKQGGVLRYSQNPNSFVPTGAGNADNGDIASLLNPSQSKAKGATPSASAPNPANANLKAQALAQLGTVYTKIASDPANAAQYQQQYPGMFDASGNLLPRQVLIDRVNQRYGN